MAAPYLIVPGQRFHRFVVIREADRQLVSGRMPRRRFLCRCDCGLEVSVLLESLTTGKSQSCGCLVRETTTARNTKHGDSKTGSKKRLYSKWAGMKCRCSNPNDEFYRDYGGRGITVCSEWHDYIAFRDWALANGYRDDLTIERIDVNLGYQPGNCKFIPGGEQASNTRRSVFLTAFRETKTVAQWSADPRCVVKPKALQYRIQKGWEHETAITLPPDILNRRKPGRLKSPKLLPGF